MRQTKKKKKDADDDDDDDDGDDEGALPDLAQPVVRQVQGDQVPHGGEHPALDSKEGEHAG